MPTLRNSIEIEVTGAVVLVVNVTRPPRSMPNVKLIKTI